MEQLQCTFQEESVEFEHCVFPTYLYHHSGAYKGRVVIVHGYRDLHEFYFGLINVLTAGGYDVFFYFMRGEGTSKPASNSYASNDDSRVYKDMDFIIKRNLDQLQPAEKLNLFGHSLGGALVLCYAAIGTYKDRLRCVASCAPLIELAPETGVSLVEEWALRTVCHFVPPARYIRIKTPLRVEFLSTLPEIQQHILNRESTSQLRGTLVEARDFVLRGRRLLHQDFYSQISTELPVAIFHGDDDHINDCRASQKFIDGLQKIGNKHAQYHEFKDGRHELLAEFCSTDFFDGVLKFLDANSGAGQ
ncbi:hypothetical protein OGAPHI_002919 [Ogataea philodendri]|uniref:Serine aminopeptidase S33 domain-containing protein n=1 Tax=Ogataea philodendri TaxID=1378263 RepID=A0A9P8P936_9ASCO|nr:uncharacterized protein OGAPHI_002919 [Ogataea philodendri]KAH3667270.1 hypothetical protein OGAPHI_002919 [Ogataea philodendri]